MVFEHIEQLKRDYTDRFVVVDDSRPELQRFQGQTGRVKTVNMSGRALVEFDQYSNIGWFDIDVDFLKVVDRPPPAEPEKKPAKKPAKKPPAAAKASAGDKKLSPLEMARMQGAAGSQKTAPAAASKPAAGGKLSTADVLAAARGKQAAKATADPAPAAAKAPPAAASGKKPSEMTLAEKLELMRGEKAATPATEEAPPEETSVEPTAEAPAAESKPQSAEKVDKSTMSIDQMVAWCREHDAGTE